MPKTLKKPHGDEEEEDFPVKSAGALDDWMVDEDADPMEDDDLPGDEDEEKETL